MDSSIQLFGPVYFQKQGIWLVFILTMFYKNSVVNENSVDPDQMLQNVASDLGLHLFANYPFGVLQTKMD